MTEMLRGLIKDVVLTPTDGDLAIDLRGDLAGILAGILVVGKRDADHLLPLLA